MPYYQLNQPYDIHPHQPPVGGWWPLVALADPKPYLLYEGMAHGGQPTARLARRNFKANESPICFPSIPPWIKDPIIQRAILKGEHMQGMPKYSQWLVPLRISGVEHDAQDDGQGNVRVRVAFWIACPVELHALKKIHKLLPEEAMAFIGSGYPHLPRAWMVGAPECPLRRAIPPHTQAGGLHAYRVEYSGVDTRPYRLVGGLPMGHVHPDTPPNHPKPPYIPSAFIALADSQYVFYPFYGDKAYEIAMGVTDVLEGVMYPY